MEQKAVTVNKEPLLVRIGLGRRELRAWAMYDWANSAYAAVVMAAVLPPFFSTYFAAGLGPARATKFYALITSLALLVTAVVSPVLGVMADRQRAKKRWLAFFVLLGAAAVSLLFLVPRGAWLPAGALIMVAAIAFGVSLVFYDGLLPGLASAVEFDRVSAAGYALGYVGGGLLLAGVTLAILQPGLFHLPGPVAATKWGLITVAVWWVGFSLPLFRVVPEPTSERGRWVAGEGPLVIAACRDLINTFREIRQYRDLFFFLLAFWFYNDGIGTIIKMATIFGAELGIGMGDLVMALLITQFVACPFAFFFGQLGSRIGARRGIYIALAVYSAIAILGFMMTRTWQFYALAILVGTVQGGAQALSRSLFATMVPRGRAGEFFGFFSVSSKFAAVAGPALFAIMIHLTGSSRYAVLSILLFFVAGALLLSRVDLERGARRVADGVATPGGYGDRG